MEHTRKKEPIGQLISRLRASEPGAAWVEFLDRYARLIMKAASQFEYSQDRIDDCFLHVCEKLCDDDFRRLLQFDPAGKARFESWLSTVVFNLCVDWHRQEFGRARLLPAISALPEFDQSVYRLAIEEGLGRETCYQTLRMDFPDLERQSVANALARIHTVLTPRQRWQISVRQSRRRASRGNEQDWRPETFADSQPHPQAEAERRQSLDAIHRALDRLPPEQRLLIHWRFQEGLPLRKIAQLARLGDTNRAWRHIQAAVNALMEQLPVTERGAKRKN